MHCSKLSGQVQGRLISAPLVNIRNGRPSGLKKLCFHSYCREKNMMEGKQMYGVVELYYSLCLL